MLKKIGVVGAGMMGSEIALVFALAGHCVYITDKHKAHADNAIHRLRNLLERGIERGKYPKQDIGETLARIATGADLQGYADCDIVFEAVFESVQVKAEIYRRLQPVLRDDCILATNTSSISITVLSGNLDEKRRHLFLGTHFFSPASRMRLVEVIPAMDTAAGVVDEVLTLLRSVGKEPVRVKDVVGFAVNRLLHIFFIEAIRLVEEEVMSIEDLDKACKLGLGHPVGPFELMDATANDLGLDVQGILRENYGERFMPRQLLRAMVAAGYNGKKAGRGWYRYSNGKRLVSSDEK